MIGSPNYIFGVMDGDLSDTKDSPDNAYTGTSSHHLALQTSNFASINFSPIKEKAPFLKRFLSVPTMRDLPIGVAFGGLFTGAEKTKTAEEVVKFGGEIDVAYDHCYHQACDDLNNISQRLCM